MQCECNCSPSSICPTIFPKRCVIEKKKWKTKDMPLGETAQGKIVNFAAMRMGSNPIQLISLLLPASGKHRAHENAVLTRRS
jgi:hypothetical protein